ncbi:serine hydrolase domain-containing protein [Pseudooceanicola onchidii]|uniref:serine hydrolase domain-containing protein n=1 Tax=Pseudooceanicola onchidii TaxID=2562279 RepID=UPI0010AB10F3|nr:serine hydrolase domain-containing protein [Pseudooceanicola onchidii]
MLRLVLVLALTATVARSEGLADAAAMDRVPAFEAAFDGWLDQVGARTGVLALRYNGQPVATWARGRDADDPVPLASLSKAITATCIAALVDEGRLAYDSRAGAVLDLPDAAPVTIGDLLSHATGLQKDYTQGPMAFWKDRPDPRWAEITPRALDPARLTGGRSYYYSNENYAVLGTVIEAVAGMPYTDACRARVLDPVGVSGAPSDRFAAYMPWGGWQMTMGDYARFVDHAFGPGGVLTDRLATLPEVVIDGPVRYGMGMIQRDMGDGRNVWHFGALCFLDGPNLGSYAVHWRSGWTLTAWYDACITGQEMADLDRTMVQIAYAP